MLRDDLFAAERHHDHGADVGMRAVRRERLVRELHVGPQLTAARGVRQRRANRRDRRGDALGHPRRTDHGRHDEQMVAHADAAVGPAVSLETDGQPRAHTSLPSGSASRPADAGCWRAAARSPRPRALATLCVWTCAPGRISTVATPIELPYLITGAPGAIRASASLCPRGIASRTVTAPVSRSSTRPRSSASSAVATLSPALMTITGFEGFEWFEGFKGFTGSHHLQGSRRPPRGAGPSRSSTRRRQDTPPRR